MRYKKKINLFLADVDPFLLLEKKTHQRISFSELPPVDASDLVSYLVFANKLSHCKTVQVSQIARSVQSTICQWLGQGGGGVERRGN